jgi:hypothetical protein
MSMCVHLFHCHSMMRVRAHVPTKKRNPINANTSLAPSSVPTLRAEHMRDITSVCATTGLDPYILFLVGTILAVDCALDSRLQPCERHVCHCTCAACESIDQSWPIRPAQCERAALPTTPQCAQCNLSAVDGGYISSKFHSRVAATAGWQVRAHMHYICTKRV